MVRIRMESTVGAMKRGTLQEVPAELARVLLHQRLAVLDSQNPSGCVGIERAAVDVRNEAEIRERL